MSRRLAPFLAAAARAGGRIELRLPARLAASLNRRLQKSMRAGGVGAAARRALLRITPSAAARMPLLEFLEQVAYNGKRLAKLGVEPEQALAVFDEYAGWLPAEPGLEALRWAVALALNDSYYKVRGAEAQAFFCLAQAELDAAGAGEMIDQALSIIARAISAQAGAWKWVDGHLPRRLQRPLYLRGDDPAVQEPLRGAACCWSLPVVRQGRPVAVVQFGFSARYRWLPREISLIQAASERCAAWAERARLLQELRQQQQKIRLLGAHSLQVEENERRRIGRDLHDETGQSLLFMRLELEMLEGQLAGSPSHQRVRAVRQVMERTISEIRRTIAALSPTTLERYGLAAAIRHQVGRMTEAGLRVHLRLPRTFDHVSPTVQIVLYRVLQESCNNILKHAQAKTVKIDVVSADKAVEMTVADNGIGFHTTAAKRKNGSFGLSGMNERVALVGGRFEIESKPGRGTRISVTIPGEEIHVA